MSHKMLKEAKSNIGKYIEWNHGTGAKSYHKINGVYIDADLELRYDLDMCTPMITHKAITGILTEDEVKAKIAEQINRNGEQHGT